MEEMHYGISEQIVCGWEADLFPHPCRMKNRKYKKYSSKQEIQKVFLCFPFFCLRKNLSLPALADFIRVSLFQRIAAGRNPRSRF